MRNPSHPDEKSVAGPAGSSLNIAQERGLDVFDRLTAEVAKAADSGAVFRKNRVQNDVVPKIPGCEIRGLLGVAGWGPFILHGSSGLNA